MVVVEKQIFACKSEAKRAILGFKLLWDIQKASGELPDEGKDNKGGIVVGIIEFVLGNWLFDVVDGEESVRGRKKQ